MIILYELTKNDTLDEIYKELKKIAGENAYNNIQVFS